MKMRMLISADVRRFFSLPWNLRVAVLVVPAILLSLWGYMPSPFVPIFAALFIGLEPQYCNIFFHTPNEFEALSVMPLHWTDVILAKNLSTIVITLICLPIVSILVLYFSPDTAPAHQFINAGLYFLSILFPLLHAGNLQSLLHPRRHLGWHMDDLAGSVLMAVFLAVFSIPYFVLVEAAGSPPLCLLYAGATGIFWFRHSFATTARRVMDSTSTLCTAR